MQPSLDVRQPKDMKKQENRDCFKARNSDSLDLREHLQKVNNAGAKMAMRANSNQLDRFGRIRHNKNKELS